MMPRHVQSLFWDTKLDDFDPARYPRYTIERVLEHGDDEDVAWLVRVFTKARIQEVLRGRHRLSPRSANFWALVFDISPDRRTARPLTPISGGAEFADEP